MTPVDVTVCRMQLLGQDGVNEHQHKWQVTAKLGLCITTKVNSRQQEVTSSAAAKSVLGADRDSGISPGEGQSFMSPSMAVAYSPANSICTASGSIFAQLDYGSEAA